MGLATQQLRHQPALVKASGTETVNNSGAKCIFYVSTLGITSVFKCTQTLKCRAVRPASMRAWQPMQRCVRFTARTGRQRFSLTKEHATVFKKVPKRSESYSSALLCFAVVLEKSDLKHSMTTGNGEEAVDLVRLRCSACRSTRMCQHETVARFCDQIYSQGPNCRRRSPPANRQPSASTSWFGMG